MSHRTRDLPPLSGAAHALRELRYHEGTRQGFAVVLVVLYAATAAPLPVLAAVGLTVGLVGALVRLYASGFIVKNQELATDGPYRFVRHPLYTGNILLVVGFALAGSRWWAIPVALFFFWFYYPTAIEYEDRKLHRIFGAAWERWAAATPALVPGLRGSAAQAGPSATTDGGTAGDGASDAAAAGPSSNGWSFATSLKRNGELLLVAFAVLCAVWVVWRIE
jgi:hypothetical protein